VLEQPREWNIVRVGTIFPSGSDAHITLPLYKSTRARYYQRERRFGVKIGRDDTADCYVNFGTTDEETQKTGLAL